MEQEELIKLKDELATLKIGIFLQRLNYYEPLLMPLISDEVDQSDFSQLCKSYRESGFSPKHISRVGQEIFSIAQSINFDNIITGQVVGPEILDVIIADLVSNFLYYDRKNDEQVSVSDMRRFFDNDPDAVAKTTELFRNHLTKQSKPQGK